MRSSLSLMYCSLSFFQYIALIFLLLATFQERFGDSDIRDLGEFESGEHRWDRAEILRIYGCDELDLTLRTNRDDFSDYMSGKILIVEDIKLLDLDFTAGLSPESDNSFYTVSP